MKLNRKLRQRCWLEVKHFVLDECLGRLTPFRGKGIVHFNFHERSSLTPILTSILTTYLTPFLLPFLLPKLQLCKLNSKGVLRHCRPTGNSEKSLQKPVWIREGRAFASWMKGEISTGTSARQLLYLLATTAVLIGNNCCTYWQQLLYLLATTAVLIGNNPRTYCQRGTLSLPT